ncbi:MAG TPA: ATP-binding protein, partial [Bacteroidota bacterium]
NILGIILGYVTLLQSVRPAGIPPPPELDAIESAAQRGTTLVRQILTFARKGEVALAPVHLNDVVQELARMAVETFPRTIEISMHLDPSIPVIHADAAQIHQALLNLCVNARDAILDSKKTGLTSGRISIRTALVKKEEIQGLFPGAAAPAYAALSVADTGVGMDELTRSRVFEPFFTTKEQGRGTGLGLAVVYGTIQSHRGFINVQSRVGRGSTFTLYFPTPGGASGIGAQTGEPGEAPGGTETILLVEDEEPLLQLVRVFMERKGYRVLVARDGAEAVETFGRHAKEIALVVSDYGLPRLSGIDSFRKMRELRHDVRMILVSGNVEPRQRTEIVVAGVTDVIQKPYVFDEILRKVREVLDRP